MITRFEGGPTIDARIYLESGSPRDNHDPTEAMADVLRRRGYVYRHVVQPGARHEWSAWRARFDELLEFLY